MDQKSLAEATALVETYRRRRSCRRFSSEPVEEKLVRRCIEIAATAPSGANQQPWTYVLVGDAETKSEIRRKAESVEREFYRRRITEEWQSKLDPLGVDWQKPFLEEAPYIVCVFVRAYDIDTEGNHVKHYYPNESVAISVGFFISAVHQLGLATLPYTPAPMGFLREILERPQNERPEFVLPVGKPDPDYVPPDIPRRDLSEVIVERL